MVEKVTCKYCKGTGRTKSGKICKKCNGDGQVPYGEQTSAIITDTPEREPLAERDKASIDYFIYDEDDGYCD